MVFNVEYIKTVIETSVNQIKKERLCLVGCQDDDKSICLGGVLDSEKVIVIDIKGMISERKVDNIAFGPNTCPVFRESIKNNIE